MTPEVDAVPMAQAATQAAGPPAPAGSAQAAVSAGVEVGQEVRIAGKRGFYRVVGFRPGGVQLMDDDQKWHVVRPDAVRPLRPTAPPRPETGRTRSARG